MQRDRSPKLAVLDVFQPESLQGTERTTEVKFVRSSFRMSKSITRLKWRISGRRGAPRA